MGGNLLVLTDGGQFVLVAADPKEHREISLAQICGRTWCNPSWADGNLYVRAARELLSVTKQAIFLGRKRSRERNLTDAVWFSSVNAQFG